MMPRHPSTKFRRYTHILPECRVRVVEPGTALRIRAPVVPETVVVDSHGGLSSAVRHARCVVLTHNLSVRAAANALVAVLERNLVVYFCARPTDIISVQK